MLAFDEAVPVPNPPRCAGDHLPAVRFIKIAC